MAISVSEVVARRYAGALLDVATETGLGELCITDLEKFMQVIKGEPGLAEAFDNPTMPVKSVRNIIAELATRLGLNQTTASFLAILAARRRLSGIEKIIAAYRNEQDKRAGRARGEIKSAGTITAAQVATVRDAIGSKLGKQLILVQKRDPSLLGGLQVTVGDQVYDLSTRTWLDSLRSRLLQNR
jgi:F-type H+-transporting ATPase subunit delta